MRLGDIISNQERDFLKFHSFQGFSKPVYLPIFQTAGTFENAIAVVIDHATLFNYNHGYRSSTSVKREQYNKLVSTMDSSLAESIGEVWELGVWFLRKLLGNLHQSDFLIVETTFNRWNFTGEVMVHSRLEVINHIVDNLKEIIVILHAALPKRITRSVVTYFENRRTNRPERKKVSGGIGMKRSSSSSKGLSDLDKNNGHLSPRRLKMKEDFMAKKEVKPIYIDNTRDQIRKKLGLLLLGIKALVRTPVGDGADIAESIDSILSFEKGFLKDDLYASDSLDNFVDDETSISIVSKLYGLLAAQFDDVEPASPEARRRLTFFATSIFMDLPSPPPLDKLLSWSCNVPYYNEDVLYSRKDLESRNEDGLSTIIYMKALYRNDWNNLIERLGLEDEQQIWSRKYFHELRMWASFRAQTLARTVEGMMYYEAALRLLCRIENVESEKVDDLVKSKFQLLLSCQVYDRMKRVQDPKAEDIDRLLKRFPNLRVAYIDKVNVYRDEAIEYYSVLIKSSESRERIEEVYRIKLPGNPIFGEGKPENQNLSLMFTRGEKVQTIDMNQDGYFEEALKIRSLLQEFEENSDIPTTIVGFREHIFTGSVSSLANYMALQEKSFVTIGHRVLDRVLRARLHYGHPDLFDKIFFMTRGGISKASKGINLSEDIFAGYKNILRGGKVKFREYIQVGKGRDVGMRQIYKFEAKLAQGAAEQSLSRDLNRIGTRLDFFRLLSFYFGGLGYYISSFLTTTTITFVVYFLLFLAIFDLEVIGERKIVEVGKFQMLLAGMGIVNTLPMLSTLMVEKGLRKALFQIFKVFVTGGPIYFMFHIQTRSYYFYQTLLAGGAQYRATGRGFVIHHSCFDNLYRFFAVSHFYMGFELLLALVLLSCTTQAGQVWGRTWSLWLAGFSFILPPFWFNPLAFYWGKVFQDYKKWIKWMGGTSIGSSKNSWEIWWREENCYFQRLTVWRKLPLLVKPIAHFVIGVQIAMPNIIKIESLGEEYLFNMALLCLCALILIIGYFIIDRFEAKLPPWVRRSGKLVIFGVLIVYSIMLVVKEYKYIRMIVGMYYIMAALSKMSLLFGYTALRRFYFYHDFILGNVIFMVLFVAAALQIPKSIQTWMLFNNALDQGVVIDDVLKYARMAQEQNADESRDKKEELKNLIQKQDSMLKKLTSYSENVKIETDLEDYGYESMVETPSMMR
eukprot:CAMPEP_0171471610 /NCGR_PEP_ID=MMETSP0946-20130122/804_1 /TAXON_ID=109269 /ORGANISM="Vaucheria litorea, Strain CCMP2940" /LENGTH=1191 /DNA_ID=CAMNT_0012001127 /DNA_START=475 /DNA_END=4047 /DNA_ORIENTATION=-